MSTARGGKLKAEYNRVRTSTSLKANDMWSKTIGQEANPQAGSNAAVEASIYAPSHGGSKRAERQENAQKLIEKVGYNAQVTDYQGLLDLAKTQGSFGVSGEKVRGACKRCGGLGHMTRQCTNFVTGHTAAAGPLSSAVGAPSTDRGLLPAPGEMSDLEDLSSSSSSDSEAEEKARKSDKIHKRKDKKKEKKRRRESSDEDGDVKKKKHKKHKHSKDKKHSKKSKKDKHKKRSSSSSDSD